MKEDLVRGRVLRMWKKKKKCCNVRYLNAPKKKRVSSVVYESVLKKKMRVLKKGLRM